MDIENGTAHIEVTPADIDLATYDQFLAVKTLPRYSIGYDDTAHRWDITFPAEYAIRLGDDSYQHQAESMPLPLPDFFFDRQQVITQVAWHKKRYAIFADAGLGKTLCFLEIARQLEHLGKKTLIVSPLNVIDQTIEQSLEFYGPEYPHIINLHGRADHNGTQPKSLAAFIADPDYHIAIINHEFFIRSRNLSGIECIILDESSILKSAHGRISTNLIANCKGIPRKIACSATPSPNDRIEYARHASWLEMVRSDTEFIAMFFVQKDQGYVLRHHAKKKFYQFLAGWSIFIRDPAVYGFENNLNLEPYEEIRQLVPMTTAQNEMVFNALAETHQQMSMDDMPEKPKDWKVRQLYNQVSKGFRYGPDKKPIYVESHKPRVIREFIESYPGEKAIVWCVYDEEGEIIYRELEQHTKLRIAHLSGKTPMKKRIVLINQFRHGKIDVMITKPRLLGLGLNLHVSSLSIFSGLRDSFELVYQAIKRSWRYPQEKRVKVFFPYTSHEEQILENVLRKREQAEHDFTIQEQLYAESLYDEIQAYLAADVIAFREEKKKMVYDPVITEEFELYHTDSIHASLDGLLENSTDLIVTSIPFRNDLFAYTDDAADMGNSGGVGEAGRWEFLLHLSYCLKGMFNTLKPGRLCCIEISQSPLRKGVDGVIGMSDFRGDVIRMAEKQGFLQFGEIPVLGNPQTEAIVKHITTLSMNYIREDRAKLVPMFNDYILIFKKPGENKEPITNPIHYYPLDELLYLDQDAQPTLDDMAHEWSLFLGEPAKNEWGLVQIADRIINRSPGLLTRLEILRDSNVPQSETPFYVRVDKLSGEWLIPVEDLQMNNEQWIEAADGIWQEQEFNRNATMATATKQGVRFQSYLDKMEVSLNEALQVLAGAFVDINQGDTLNTPYSRGRTKEMEDADKHVCPFSIPLVDRLIRLYSNPGDTVLDPFTGIGTVLMVAIELGRKALGMELKPEYFLQAVEICQNAVEKPVQMTMF
ncbi:MAG: DNA methyltransferase [Candidatus Thorarchaeota archaeon]|jgi:DNA modification methylase